MAKKYHFVNKRAHVRRFIDNFIESTRAFGKNLTFTGRGVQFAAIIESRRLYPTNFMALDFLIMIFPNPELTITAEDLARELSSYAGSKDGQTFLSIAAMGMGHMMNAEGESGQMSKTFLDAVVVLGKSPNRNNKLLAVKLGMLFRDGKRALDEERGLLRQA